MEPKTDIKRPSTTRIIAGILVLLCTFPIFVYGNFGIDELMQFPYKKMSFFEHIWGKLLVILVSGTIYLTLLGVMTIFLLIALKSKHSKKCTFYTLRFGCSFAAVNTIKPQLL